MCIENASDKASVPQALTMMNGPLGSQVVSGWSVLAINLRKAASPEQKLDTLFLSLYSRHPSTKERDALSTPTFGKLRGDKTIWEDLTLAALSTQQFLFIKSARLQIHPSLPTL